MTLYRTFRNGDPPRLAALWNRHLPGASAAGPLAAHEFDAAAIDRIDFDPRGLIVAERDGHVVGFAHAGFGPEEPAGPSHRPDTLIGTVAMLHVEPGPDERAVGRELLDRAEDYLRGRGARVIYAGGQAPLDPFYRSIYGGSEWSGILDDHRAFRATVEAAGYGVAAESVLLDLDLLAPEARDPKAPILRRQARLEVVEDALPAGWWEALGLGPRPVHRYRLVAKADGTELARASTWEMFGFGPGGPTRVGLRDVEVDPAHRRKGFGRHLVLEVARQVRTQWGEVLAATTGRTNTPALALYESVGFRPTGTALLYRKPGA